MNKEDETFRNGHVVTLRSGSPAMTIICDNVGTTPMEYPHRVVCVAWFDGKTNYQAKYPISALRY